MTNPNDAINPLDTTQWTDDMQDMPLTKREYFAAMALQGVCANAGPGTPKELTEFATACADALITALNKEAS